MRPERSPCSLAEFRLRLAATRKVGHHGNVGTFHSGLAADTYKTPGSSTPVTALAVTLSGELPWRAVMPAPVFVTLVQPDGVKRCRELTVLGEVVVGSN